MKIRLVVKDKKKFEDKLLKAGFEITDDASIVLLEEDFIIDQVIGKVNDELVVIHINDIIFFESIDRHIYVYTKNNKYQIKERLFELEQILDAKKFIRISQAVIVNRYMIQKITPLIGSKYTLIMSNQTKVIVTRNYYFKFREFFKI